MGEREVILSDKFVKWFSGLGKNDWTFVGEKGANLAEMFNKKIPVPNGFIITTSAFEYFLEKAEIKDRIKSIISQINEADKNQIENYLSNIRKLILSSEFPEELREEILDSYENLGVDKGEIEKGSAYDILNNAQEPVFVSVRSSLSKKDIVKKKIREQDTYLNVKGKSELIVHIKKCFASLFNEETVRRELASGDLDDLKIAVVVQEMIESDKSGISYSDNGNISIESIWGLGEGMNISGLERDQYILSRELELIEQRIGNKLFGVKRDSGGNLKKVDLSEERKIRPSLSLYEMQRIGDLYQKIEGIFGKPQEIEFAIEGGEIYILQSRKKKQNILENSVQIGSTSKEEYCAEQKIEEFVKEEVVSEKENNSEGEIQRVEKITRTKLKLVVDSPNFIEKMKQSGLRKAGLVKIEKIIKQIGKHPDEFLKSNYINEYENKIYDKLKLICESFDESWVRLSDIRSDEMAPLDEGNMIGEKNPLMGLHGIRFGLKNPEILKAELNAIKRVQREGNRTGILIPMITSVEEVQKVMFYLEEIDFSDAKIGIIVETPSAVQLIKDLTEEEIELVLMGTDYLTQFLLGIDKENSSLREFYDDMNPALMYQLEYVNRVCKRKGIETGVYGKVLERKEMIEFLVRKEFTFLNVVPELAKNISETVFEVEESFRGTDKEPRQYELKKNEEEVLENAPKTWEEYKLDEEVEKANKIEPEVVGDVESDIEESVDAIEEEKEEYLKEHPEEEMDEEPEEHEGIIDLEKKDTFGVFS